MDDLIDELRNIGCHLNGDQRCTCAIGIDAADRIENLETALRDMAYPDGTIITHGDPGVLREYARKALDSEKEPGS